MPTSIPRSLVEFILLGPEDDRRQLQDSPILGDVWLEFAKSPAARLELLITPYKTQPAVKVAKALKDPLKGRSARIAYLHGIVAASLTFEEVLTHVVPLTGWWTTKLGPALKAYVARTLDPKVRIDSIFDAAAAWMKNPSGTSIQDIDTRRRYAALMSLILWAARTEEPTPAAIGEKEKIGAVLKAFKPAAALSELQRVLRAIDRLPKLCGKDDDPFVWTVSLNRQATPAVARSVPAVKADAARTLFTVDCSDIVWAVIDSGIDATHPAFLDTPAKGKKAESRVKKVFDFTRIRDLVSLDNLDGDTRSALVTELLDKDRKLKAALNAARIDAMLLQLAEGAEQDRPINWETLEQLVELRPDVRPPTNHGTHVAGILAANRKAATRGIDEKAAEGWGDGMCPDIRLWDFRVLAPSLAETEFAIIAALQYIRYVNERNSYMTVHGANLSLSIPHDVRNYACGRTPICNECERLVSSGVVVVAAAGNRGYQKFETSEGRFESYAAFSVTDPGNAEGVITVGSTHRYWPHTYGVSFFSSRGPTGDGRLKPDLVAPGEKVRAPIRDKEWGDLDGTSMAAPHVSGAAAMLMARYSELVGNPRRIKDLLCRSATDLGRERSFQGHGMLDVLRAFQDI